MVNVLPLISRWCGSDQSDEEAKEPEDMKVEVLNFQRFGFFSLDTELSCFEASRFAKGTLKVWVFRDHSNMNLN